MKQNLALIIAFTSAIARAQFQMLDTTTLHTNNASTHAFISIPGICTNAPYTTTNYIYVTVGDSIPSAAWTKLNSDLNYLTNQLILALQLPNQINTNMQYWINFNSNSLGMTISSLNTVSNFANSSTASLTNFVLNAGGRATNLVLRVGADLTNRLNNFSEFPDIADGHGVVSLGGGLEINTNHFGVCGITNKQGDLSFIMKNDSDGSSALHLWNRDGANGACFENLSDGEIDFNFMGTRGSGYLFNLRVETRGNSQLLAANDPVNGGLGEFQYLAPNGTPSKIFAIGANGAAFPTNVWFNAWNSLDYANDSTGPQYPIDMAGSGLIGESDNGNTGTIQLDDGSGNMTFTTSGQQNFSVTHGTAAIQNGSGSSDIVLKLQSPNGTVYYLHVNDSGVLSATTSP